MKQHHNLLHTFLCIPEQTPVDTTIELEIVLFSKLKHFNTFGLTKISL